VQQYLFQFERLVQELFPRLGAHFEEECINPSMYASQWFITVFSYSFPFSLALRIWDVFLSEGMKVRTYALFGRSRLWPLSRMLVLQK
jgi:hypothetical protein